MKLNKPSFPKELDADVAMSVLIPHAESLAGKDVSFIYDFKGIAERTALGDDLNIGIRNRQDSTSIVRFSLKRDSLYHILPEYLFHPLDHYLNTDGDTEEFDKKYKEQEEQKNKALTYFRPFDRHYQQLRTGYQRWLNDNIFSGNQFLADFITEGYDVNLDNPFIKAVYPCVPWLNKYRGNDGLIRTALGYAFKGNVHIDKVRTSRMEVFNDSIHSSLYGTLDGLYCASSYKARLWVWKVFYQTVIKTSEELDMLKMQADEFSEFFSLWFLPVDTELDLSFGDRTALPDLTETGDKEGVFLNYSTQLI